jgi:hypothetical protein
MDKATEKQAKQELAARAQFEREEFERAIANHNPGEVDPDVAEQVDETMQAEREAFDARNEVES